MTIPKKIVIAVTGASGAIYAKIALDFLKENMDKQESVDVVFSVVAKKVWKHELALFEEENYPFRFWKPDDFYAPFASGSAGYDAMIVIPCSMGTLGRIASGISSDLISRTADVMLKERKKLVLVVRETPYNAIHIENMRVLTNAGAVIFPASPSFYSQPTTIEKLAETVSFRALELIGFQTNIKRWGS